MTARGRGGPEARLAAARASALAGAHARAVALAREAARRWPDSPAPLLLLARLDWKRGPAAAAALLDRALALDPGSAYAWCLRGELARRQGRPAEALDDLERGLRALPGDPRPRVWRARALDALGRTGEALVEAERALALAPARARTLGERAWLLARLGRFDEARDGYRRALRLEARAAPEPDETLETLEGKREMLARLRFRRFAASAALGDCDEALRDLRLAHALDLKYAWLGGPPGEGPAPETLDEALRRRPRRGWLHAWLGRGLLEQGRPEEALGALERAVRRGARGPWIAAWRGLCEARLGREPSGERSLRLAARSRLPYPLVPAALAETELRRGRHAAAAAWAGRAAVLYHHGAWAHGLLGEALAGLGRARQARAALDEALAIDPSYERARALRALCAER